MKPLIAIAYFVLGSICLAALHHDEILLAGIVLLFSALMLMQCSRESLKKYAVAVLVGGFCENTAVWLGGWSYSGAAFLPAPLWLPLGWGFTIIIFEEAFGKKIPVKFSVFAVPLAIIGAVATALLGSSEFLALGLFALVTVALFAAKFYMREEMLLGAYAAVLGTAMEALSIFAGNWDYPHAIVGVPLWLPLCWFNAYLIMRRIIRI